MENQNSTFIANELEWLEKLIDDRIKRHFKVSGYKSNNALIAPSTKGKKGSYVDVILNNQLEERDRVALILALAPHIKPSVLDLFFTKNTIIEKPFTEFGSRVGRGFQGIIPTGETLLFILAGQDISERLEIEQYFLNKSPLFSSGTLALNAPEQYEPVMSGSLIMSSEQVLNLKFGKSNKPTYSVDFPAKIITTNLEWNDLVLDPHVLSEIEDLMIWLNWNKQTDTDAQVKRIIKPGFRALFHGASGTGKTLTASLLGKQTQRDVYRIDLSMLISKYIGETEKNLAAVFNMAEHKDWILFFDEADALFGKRTTAANSNDRHSNQEISYLLQRIEDYPGLVLLSTNLKMNIDDAFSRRFQAMIHFPIPNEKQRLKLWEAAFQKSVVGIHKIKWETIANGHVLTGGAIVNVLMHCILQMKKNKTGLIEEYVESGIRRELLKEGKMIQVK